MNCNVNTHQTKHNKSTSNLIQNKKSRRQKTVELWTLWGRQKHSASVYSKGHSTAKVQNKRMLFEHIQNTVWVQNKKTAKKKGAQITAFVWRFKTDNKKVYPIWGFFYIKKIYQCCCFLRLMKAKEPNLNYIMICAIQWLLYKTNNYDENISLTDKLILALFW